MRLLSPELVWFWNRIKIQKSTESISALDCAFVASLQHKLRKNEGVPNALTTPFKVVVGDIVFEHMLKRPFAEKNHSIQTVGFDRQDKPLRVCIQIR